MKLLFLVFEYYVDVYNDFKTDWLFYPRKKDSSDVEWETFLQIFHKSFVWIIVLVIGSELCRNKKIPKVKQTIIQYIAK